MENEKVIALFGQAEKGLYYTPILCRTLPQLVGSVGQPPAGSSGIFYAVQSLLRHYSLLYFRVEEEGYSQQDYLVGLQVLSSQKIIPVSALFMPGVSSKEIIETGIETCRLHHSLLIMSEYDLYDYLTA